MEMVFIFIKETLILNYIRAIKMLYWKISYYWSVANNIEPVDNVGKVIFNLRSV